MAFFLNNHVLIQVNGVVKPGTLIAIMVIDYSTQSRIEDTDLKSFWNHRVPLEQERPHCLTSSTSGTAAILKWREQLRSTASPYHQLERLRQYLDMSNKRQVSDYVELSINSRLVFMISIPWNIRICSLEHWPSANNGGFKRPSKWTDRLHTKSDSNELKKWWMK